MLTSRIVLIALDMNKFDYDENKYFLLSTEEQVKLIEQRIRYICDELKNKEPDAMWIVAWREYGIGEKRTIVPKDKKLLKQTMQKLIQEFHPNLTIVAGTISTRKHVNDLTKLKNIKKFYDEHSWIRERERAESTNPEHYNLDKEIKIIDDLQQLMPDTGIDVLRNTCYVFHNQDTWRHDKMSPFEEEKDLLHKQTVFQPGNKKNNMPYCELTHPFTQFAVTIGTEICREHYFATLRTKSDRKPMFHFIISASLPLIISNIYGEYALQLDSINKPRLILTRNEDFQTLPIHLYQSNMLEKNHNLSGPLQPLYPFVKSIIEKLNEIIIHLPNEARILVEEFRESFSIEKSNNAMHNKLKVWLKRNEKFLLNAANIKQSNLFQSNFSIKMWLQEVNEIIKNDPDKDIFHLDYHAETNALPFNQIDLFDHYLKNGNYSEALNYVFINNALLNQRKLNINQAKMLIGAVIDFEKTDFEKENLCTIIFDNIIDLIMEPILESMNQTLLHGLCEMNILFLVRAILPYCREKINQPDWNGDTAFHVAIKRHVDLEIIQILLENGANPDCVNYDNKTKTPLNLADDSYPEAASMIRKFRQSSSYKL